VLHLLINLEDCDETQSRHHGRLLWA